MILQMPKVLPCIENNGVNFWLSCGYVILGEKIGPHCDL